MKKIILGLTTVAAIMTTPLGIAAMEEPVLEEGTSFSAVATKTQIVKLKTPDGKVISVTVNAKDVQNLKKGDKIELLSSGIPTGIVFPNEASTAM